MVEAIPIAMSPSVASTGNSLLASHGPDGARVAECRMRPVAPARHDAADRAGPLLGHDPIIVLSVYSRTVSPEP